MSSRNAVRRLTTICALLLGSMTGISPAQQAPLPAASGPVPQVVDITAATGIHFSHLSSPEARYIVESMSGGVALIDFDRDGWPDIFFTNAPSVTMAQAGQKARSALYRNNHDGTFTDVTEKAGVGYPCWAMGAEGGWVYPLGWRARAARPLLWGRQALPQQSRRYLHRHHQIRRPCGGQGMGDRCDVRRL